MFEITGFKLFSSGVHVMLCFWAVVVTIGVIFDVVIVEVSIIIGVMGDVTGDDSVLGEVVTEVRGGRGRFGQLGGRRWDGDDGGI